MRELINQKTSYLDDMLLIQGKLSMLKQSLEAGGDKYSKIKKSLKEERKPELLIYKDQSDDPELDDFEEGESEYDEEIEEISIQGTKK